MCTTAAEIRRPVSASIDLNPSVEFALEKNVSSQFNNL
jgi:hypothetical protein